MLSVIPDAPSSTPSRSLRWMLRGCLTLLTLLLPVAACSPDSGSEAQGSGASGSDPGSGGEPSTETGGGTSSPDEAGGNAGTGGTSGTDGWNDMGEVAFLELYDGVHLRARFGLRRTDDCKQKQEGACRITECTAGILPPRFSAGTLSYESEERGVVRVVPQEGNIYYSADDLRPGGANKFYLGGEEAYFKATGGDVPAFEQRLDYPILPLLDQPLSSEGVVTASRSQDLTLQWSRGVAGMVISAWFEQTSESPTIICDFDAVAGQGTIPSSVLSLMPANTEILLLGLATGQVRAGDYDISLSSGARMRTPDLQHQIRVRLQ